MMNQNPKFKIGQNVWVIVEIYKNNDCNICNGSGQVSVNINKHPFTINCPQCGIDHITDDAVILGTIYSIEQYEGFILYQVWSDTMLHLTDPLYEYKFKESLVFKTKKAAEQYLKEHK